MSKSHWTFAHYLITVIKEKCTDRKQSTGPFLLATYFLVSIL